MTKRILYIAAFLILPILQFNLSALTKPQPVSSRSQLTLPGTRFYVDLRYGTAYVRTGFSKDYTLKNPIEDNEARNWLAVNDRDVMLTIRDLDIPNFSYPHNIDPFRDECKEFTIVIPFIAGGSSYTDLQNDTTRQPAISLAGIGDNWEIYLNGNLLKSEMHLNSNGDIISHRQYRTVCFPLNKSSLREGENIFALRIVGSPEHIGTGLFYLAPYYIADYEYIRKADGEVFVFSLIAIYLFMGLYHLFMYTLRKKDRTNLFFGLLSLCVGSYFLCRTHTIYSFIENSLIVMRFEYSSLFFIIPLFISFLETLIFNKVHIVTKLCGVFYALLAVSLYVFAMPFSEWILFVWKMSSIPAALFIIIYDIRLGIKVTANEIKKVRAASGKEALSAARLYLSAVPASPFGNILVGALICVAFAIFDIFDSLYLHYSTLLSPVGFFIFTIGIALVLIRRSVNFYIKQDRIIARTNKLINARLVDWVVVQDRDPYDIPSSTEKIAIMFTDVRNFTSITEKMDSKAVTGFLCSLWEVLVKPLHYYEKHGFVAYTDKFIGDAMMNVFTDPLVALKAAVYFRVQLREFNQGHLKYFKEMTNEPYIDIGTGIAFGDATVGIMGHRSRLDYTSLGDTVNLASRIEGLTKTYHSPTLISDLIYEKISDTSLEEFNLRLVDRIRVAGKKEAVGIYEEYSSNNPVIVELKRVTKNLMNELQVAYFSNSISNLKHALRLCDHIEKYFLKEIVRCNAAPEKPGDWLPSIYRKRIQHLLANPKKLERWDGIYTFETK